ncbi:MAG: YabP/YqfC family sporulation protein [Christensenellales bacterium]
MAGVYAVGIVTKARNKHDEWKNAAGKLHYNKEIFCGIDCNMAYKEELCALVSKTLGEDILNRKITVYDNLALVEGHSGILTYNPNLIKVRVNKKVLSISGSELSVVECTANDIVVKGNIERFEVGR